VALSQSDKTYVGWPLIFISPHAAQARGGRRRRLHHAMETVFLLRRVTVLLLYWTILLDENREVG
jgi:hypothetical protein